MSIKETIARHLLLPAHERLRGRSTLSQWSSFKKNEHLSQSDFLNLRIIKLRQLINHAALHVPYYKGIFHSLGIEDASNFSIKDLRLLPVLEKVVIASQAEELKAQDRKKRLIRYSTGGSTGQPLIFFTDQHRESCLNAQKLRARSWFGVFPGDKQVDFWGSPIELSRQNQLRKIKDKWLLNQVVLSASNLTPERVATYANFLKTFQPKLIYGYATVIYRIAMHLNEQPGLLGSYRPRLIACTSEMLMPRMREIIAEAFSCPIANEYGSRDGGLIAHECPAGNLHILGEHVIVEVDQPDPHGIGDLLITNLDSFGMPFIRYRIGDRGALSNESCRCGLPMPILKELQGRANDFMVGKNGRLVHNSSADYVLRGIDAFHQYQLRQRPDHGFDLHIVEKRSLTENEKTEIRHGLCRILDENINVTFHVRDSIPPEQSGKYRWLISDAKPDVSS